MILIKPTDLQKIISIHLYNINYFDNPIQFVISLLLTQQFDKSFEYLYTFSSIQAIHLGILLNYYGSLQLYTIDLLHLSVYLYCSSIL